MKFIITLDTEGDNQWDHGRELTVENIKYIPRFQNLCDKYKIKPTYLVTHEICGDHLARELFTNYIEDGKAEIGTHLHSWTTPPFLNREGYRYNDKHHPFAYEFPDDILNDKIKALTNKIGETFGKMPYSFRSGRYGFNMNVARILIENGYLVDSSVTPFVDWSSHRGMPGAQGGPDFMNNDSFPFKYEFGGKPILEIPITIVPTKFPLKISNKIARYYFRNVDNNIFLKLLRKSVFHHQPLWLRPNLWMNADLFNDIIEEADKMKLPYIVMMFHSSELMPGCSIYWPDKDAVEVLYSLLEGLFIALQSKNIVSVTLTEAAKGYAL